MVSLYFFLSPQRCRISHRRQYASLLHWNLTIPPSLWPDRELRKYHCPCLALTPPPVAIRHLLLRNRCHPDGLHGVQSKARPNRNVPEEWVFSFQGTSGLSSLQSKFNKNPPVSRWPRRRTLVVLAGLPTVRFDFFSVLCSRIGAKKYPVSFPTRHRRRFYSVFCKLVPVYLLVTIWVTANVSKKQSSSQQIRQAVFSFGDICCSAILFYGFHQELWVTEILLHKIIRLHIMHPKICFTKFAWFFPERLNWSYAPSAWINQHFNFWSSNDIYHVNFLLICFTQSKFLSARIQNPYHRNLLIESFP